MLKLLLTLLLILSVAFTPRPLHQYRFYTYLSNDQMVAFNPYTSYRYNLNFTILYQTEDNLPYSISFFTSDSNIKLYPLHPTINRSYGEDSFFVKSFQSALKDGCVFKLGYDYPDTVEPYQISIFDGTRFAVLRLVSTKEL